ncbi:MAG: DUF362 domain-containing protein [Candidatus Helarchaeota archaeon]
MNNVYFVNSRAIINVKDVNAGKISFFNSELSLVNKLSMLIKKSKVLDIIEKGDIVAIKMHWGDHGTMKTIRSIYVRKLALEIESRGGIPFITESSGLGLFYDRTFGLGRLKIARENGYTWETCCAPLIPLDGIKGKDYVKVKNEEGVQLKEVYVGKAIMDADKIISLAHVKGHPRAGMGAAIKNIGVGCVGKRSKFNLHFYNEIPEIIANECNQCGKCAQICPENAIDINNKIIINDLCSRCYGCIGACPNKAIKVEWCNAKDTNIRILDCANAVLRAKGPENFGFINFLIDISPICDCVPYNDHNVVQDIGILASKNIYAIDVASFDLINKAPRLPDSVATQKSGDVLSQIFSDSTGADFRYIIDQLKKDNPENLKYNLIEIERL